MFDNLGYIWLFLYKILTFDISVMSKIYQTLGRKFNREDLEKAMQANQQLEDDPTLPKSYTSKFIFDAQALWRCSFYYERRQLLQQVAILIIKSDIKI